MERTGLVFVSVTALLIVGMGIVVLVAPSGTTSRGSTTTGTPTSSSTTSSLWTTTLYRGAIAGTGPDESLRPLGTTQEVILSRDGLNLDFSISSNVVFAGRGISVTIEEKNPTSGAISVPAANNWPVPGLTLAPCGTLNTPIGFGLLAGYYTSQSISKVSRNQLLDLYQPGAYSCQLILAGITGYSFAPMSDRADIYQGNGSDPALFSQTMKGGVTASGFWTSSFNTFAPGYYSIVGGDEWGTLIILHFLVVQPIPPNQPLPLKFTLTMNTTRLVSGRSIFIKSDIFNSLPQILSVNGTSNWPWDSLKAGPCPFYAGIVILRGHYAQSNFTAGTDLQMYPYGLAIPCPAFLAAYYVFQPLSDQVMFFGGEATLAMGDALSGYGYYAPGQTCDVGFNCGNEKVTPFGPGIYTVVAGDEWGHLAFGYFEVTP
ncbi:MAG TPA: hypothetical protein VGR53_03340 [Nitrososphaerales archaeon]|nr:hypothetical protein [Nitrososphaerales archaeon]